jgi:hypothetical protein
MDFHATQLLNGKTATGIRVPDEVVAALGSSKRPPVKVTIAGCTYRTTVASRSGKYLIPLNPCAGRIPMSGPQRTWTMASTKRRVCPSPI